VKTLVSGRTEPGRYSVSWDGRDAAGSVVPNGVYLYRFSLEGRQLTGKVTLSR
jgi:flagellar hook assembly protein FlgD